MARSNIKAVFENDVQTVWNVITDVKNYIWRTDLSKTEIISDKQFIEYTKNGYATTFTITLFEPYICKNIIENIDIILKNSIFVFLVLA